jgi:hypothetical protein
LLSREEEFTRRTEERGIPNAESLATVTPRRRILDRRKGRDERRQSFAIEEVVTVILEGMFESKEVSDSDNVISS